MQQGELLLGAATLGALLSSGSQSSQSSHMKNALTWLPGSPRVSSHYGIKLEISVSSSQSGLVRMRLLGCGSSPCEDQ